MLEGEAELFSGLGHALNGSLEVGVTGLLVDDADVQAVAGLGLCEGRGQGEHDQCYEDDCKDFLHESILLKIFFALRQNLD